MQKVGEKWIVIKQLYLFILSPPENVRVCVQLQRDTGSSETSMSCIEKFLLNKNYFFKK